MRGINTPTHVFGRTQDGVALGSLEVVGRVKTWVVDGVAKGESSARIYMCEGLEYICLLLRKKLLGEPIPRCIKNYTGIAVVPCDESFW